MDIDVSKENIQPLRGGRNLTQLGTALQAQSDMDVQRQLQLQREKHEAAIREYQGPDPLDPWFNYIQWVEQCYPKHGHEGHMDRLIKDCLQLFEKDERYFQDRRLVKLWIKYIDCLSNPLEIYQRLYTSGIGVECSEFYRAWACYCEETGDYKKANQVYMLGLQAKAQPLDELEQAHMNFQLFFAQRMLHDDSPTKRKAASALAETRMALTSLKSFKRRNIASVPVHRAGDNIRSAVPGVVRQQGGGHPNRVPQSNVMLQIYEDEPSTSQAAAPAAPAAEDPGPASLVQACSNVENEKEVGVWTNPKTKMVHSNVVPHRPLPFTPYEDEGDVLRLSTKHLPYCVDDVAFSVPLCVPDPPDPTKISCYDKAQVYVDDTEYSLEEIRARKYKLKKKSNIEDRETSRSHQSYSNINETLAQCSALETLANCALEPEHDHLAQLTPLAVPAIQHITKLTHMHSPGEPKVLVNLDSKEFSELSSRKNDENQRTASDDKENKAATTSDTAPESGPSNFGRNNLMEEFNRSLMGNFLHDSVTVNTKEARWELRNLFNDNNEPTLVQAVVPQFDVHQFDIHEDRTLTMAISAKRQNELTDARALPEDKENATEFTVPLAAPSQANKTAYYEDPSSTQVFNFNIKDASTPNMAQFKKPANNMDLGSKYPSVPKFSIDENEAEQPDGAAAGRPGEQLAAADTPGATAGLSVIMEATREYNSKSGSSSSGQSTKTNFTGHTTNYDSMMYSNPNDPHLSKRSSMSSQPRHANGQFARLYPQKPHDKLAASPTVPYLSHDHQYQKPVAQNYNGYSPQRPPLHGHYQQNYGYQHQQGYGSNQMMNHQPQGYVSPNPSAYHSPQHPGMQSPHAVSPSPSGFQSQHPGMQSPHAVSPSPSGFQSPPYSNQMGYHSPGHAMMSPQHQHVYSGRQDYPYPQQVERPHVYANQHPPQQQQQIFQSPPHPTQYQNQQYYQRSSQVAPAQPQSQAYPQGYQQAHNQYNTGSGYADANHHSANQSYSAQSPYRQAPKQTAETNVAGYGVAGNHHFHIYESPQPAQASCRNASTTAVNVTPEGSTEAQMRPNVSANVSATSQPRHPVEQNSATRTSPPPKNPVPHRSPPSALRNVRHEQPPTKIGQNSPDVGFSNQFLNFISNRNEPKDTANTPKFTNSPSISQKMHKNLYVSSPEQAQVPPSSGLSDSDSKDGMTTARTATPIQSARVSEVAEKHRDISKRQLDFEQKMEVQSEDSRDSVGKESRISSVYSRQSDFQSDGYGMDVDSENSMECATFKSTHSISLVETSDIPRPANIEFPEVIDPFNKKLQSSLLEYVQFPNKTHAEGYTEVRSVPKFQVNSVVGVGNNKFSIEKQLGKGNYGAVFLCLDLHTSKSVAVKYQKPSRPWEFYICQEIKARIKDPFMLPGYMDITTAFLGDNASLFVSEYSKYGSLLDVANKVRVATSKCINEFVVMLLTAEMLSIVHYLHKAQIIHADIKPDNFLLMKIPTQEWRTPSLQLIDLGCAIDMSLFPEGTTFKEVITTEGFTCTEMRSRRPWTYQTDLYCLAGTIHVILMGSYMKVASRLGQWNIDKKLPRYMKVSLWDKVFTTLLNVPDCAALPDLMELRRAADAALLEADGFGHLAAQLRTFANVLKCR